MSVSGDSANVERGGELFFAEGARACPACGTAARRESARFCATCGHMLGGGYFPTDSLRASYRFERGPSAVSAAMPRATGRERARVRLHEGRARARREFMPTRSTSGAVATARAFVTYALVPYIGIIFCPGALLIGFVVFVRALRSPRAPERRDAAVSIALGILVLCAQVALWWVLYKVPEWSRQSPF